MLAESLDVFGCHSTDQRNDLNGFHPVKERVDEDGQSSAPLSLVMSEQARVKSGTNLPCIIEQCRRVRVVLTVGREGGGRKGRTRYQVGAVVGKGQAGDRALVSLQGVMGAGAHACQQGPCSGAVAAPGAAAAARHACCVADQRHLRCDSRQWLLYECCYHA